MDIAWNTTLDVALNLTGYLAAGGLALVVYRIFKDRSLKHEATVPAAQTLSEAEGVSAGARSSRLRFVKLGEASTSEAGVGRVRTEETASSSSQLPGRAEIIRLARRMLDSGASEARIRQVLPVTETELALLSNGNRR